MSSIGQITHVYYSRRAWVWHRHMDYTICQHHQDSQGMLNQLSYITHYLLTGSKIYFADELLYITIISMTKATILCFYLRVFPEQKFRILVLLTMGATFAYMIAFIIVSAFQCWPISYAWTHWDGEHHGRCNNVNAQGWAAAAINIVLDVVILLLPLRLILKLSLHWKKKLQISIMLSVGGL